MVLDLPAPVAAYFTADKIGADAVSRCFTDDATVKDEGSVHTGIVEIRRWKAETAGKYNYTSEPLAVERKDGAVLITAHVAGDFPGSPIDLRYFFHLEGGKIASLEIIP